MVNRRKSRRTEPRAAATARPMVWTLRAAAVILATLGVIPMANFLTDGAGLPWWREACNQWLVWIPLVAGVALIFGRAFTEEIEALFARATRALLAPSPRVFAMLVGATTCLLSLYFGWRLFALRPVVGDEFAQRWQAHLLSTGRLFARADPHPEFFSTIQSLEVNGRWFSQFPVGWPLLLGIGELAHVPWLINPLLAGISAMAFYDFVASTTDEPSARTSALIFASSPFLLFMAGSQMNHVGTLACLTIALAAVARWLASETRAHAVSTAAIIGAAIGIAATIRPFDAAVAAAVIGAFQLRVARSKPWLYRSLLVQGVVGAIPVVMLLAANWATVGRPFAFAYDVLNGPEHRPGFHMTPLGFEHTPTRGLYMASAYLMKLDVGLLAWPVPAVLVIVITLLLQKRVSRWDNLLLAMLAGLLLGYASYWSESYFVGPRFLFAAVPIFVLYVARMPAVLRDRLRAPALRAAALLLIPLWMLVAWLAPARDNQLFGVRQLAQLYHMRSTASAITSAVGRAGLAHAIVFIPEGWHARLAARLRAYGMRPLAAEQIVAHSDACKLHEALGTAETLGLTTPAQRARFVKDVLERDAPASQLAAQPPSEQIALVRGRTLRPECAEEISETLSHGMSVAELLPYVDVNARGELAGNIIYARDFGRRNELLRSQYRDRRWYVARSSFVKGELVVRMEPYTSR